MGLGQEMLIYIGLHWTSDSYQLLCTLFLFAVTLLPVFSGFYELAKDDPRQDGRPVYWDKDRRAAFRYCVDGNNGLFSFASDGYWVFNYISEDVTNVEDMCENYISRSPQTRGFDILEHPPSTWLVKRRSRDTLEYPVDYFNLRYDLENNCDAFCSTCSISHLALSP